jgi:hypothetical protein
MVVMVGICLLAAQLSYSCFEVECRKYLRTLLDKPRKAPNTARPA